MAREDSMTTQAIDHVRRTARVHAIKWRERGESLMERVGLPVEVFDTLLESVGEHGRVAIHFHPERLASDGRTVAEGLLTSGVYKTQWETGISTGSPSAFIGGARHGWEERLFGGAYEAGSAASRPRYGALRLMGHPDGPAPRFGSCYLVLDESTTQRSTCTFPGSQAPEAMEQTASIERLEPVFVPLLEAIERDGAGLGVDGLSVKAFVERALKVLDGSSHQDGLACEHRPLGRALDSFIEVQIHGPVTLFDDVDGLVADPVFQNTQIGKFLGEICRKWEIELSWHPGYRMRTGDVPDTFRGWETGRLAARIEPTTDGWIDASKIGVAANDYERNPELWPEFTSRDDALTAFRRIWHVLVQRAVPYCS